MYIEGHENYQKRSFRNRYNIGSAQGILTLSIPLQKGKNQSQNIRDVRISYAENWPKQHLVALQSSYGRSPYFNYYKDELFDLIYTRHESLYELNKASQNWLIEQFNVGPIVYETVEYKRILDSTIMDFRNVINEDSLSNLNLPAYYQVHPSQFSFLSRLSALDLLFHLGPESEAYINRLDLKECLPRLNFLSLNY